MSTKKKQCTKEFKSDAVKLVTEQGYSLSEAARNFSSVRLGFCISKKRGSLVIPVVYNVL